MRAQLLRQWFLVLPTADRDRVESHLARVLDAKMSESADAMHRDDVTCDRT